MVRRGQLVQLGRTASTAKALPEKLDCKANEDCRGRRGRKVCKELLGQQGRKGHAVIFCMWTTPKCKPPRMPCISKR